MPWRKNLILQDAMEMSFCELIHEPEHDPCYTFLDMGLPFEDLNMTDDFEILPSSKDTEVFEPKAPISDDKEASGLLQTVYHGLNDRDKKRFAFLLHCVLTKESQDTLFGIFQGTQSYDVILELFRKISSTKVNKKSLLQEMLIIMKRFKTLYDTCQMCKHEVEGFLHPGIRQIPNAWICYFNFCGQLMFEEALQLYQKLSESNKEEYLLTPESLVLAWIRTHGTGNENKNLEEFKGFVTSVLNDTQITNTLDMPSTNVYSITNSPCGIALIINEEEFTNKELNRTGSTHDEEKLKTMWESFDFEVHVRKNLKAAEIEKELDHYAKLDHSNYNVFVLCIMSHGIKGYVLGTDGQTFRIDKLYKIFGTDAKTLNKKPKLFFIQACQVDDMVNEQVETFTNAETDTTADATVDRPFQDVEPPSSDMLFLMSTVPYYVSFRQEEIGSVFIQTLIKTMAEKSDSTHMLDIATEVNDLVAQQQFTSDSGMVHKQMPEHKATLRKKLFLKKKEATTK